MNFAKPIYSAALILLSSLALFYLMSMRRRIKLTERFAEKALLKDIAPSVSFRRRISKTLAVMIAIVLSLLALARPQWGFVWEEVKRSGIDILIAVDVSKSMLARDVKPNRLERSKFAVKDLLKKLDGDRIGLIAFSGTSFLQCPLTIDYDGFLLSLDDLDPSIIPRPGTSIEAAIKEAINAFKEGDSGQAEKKYKALVIITDGEELEGDALKAAQEAARQGIRIYCVGVGTSEGELIPVIDESGQRAYLADKGGRVVKTKLNEDVLKKIALSTGGSYARATASEFGLTLLYDKSISRLEKKEMESKMKKRYEERFQLFLSLAAALLFIEPLIQERKRVLK